MSVCTSRSEDTLARRLIELTQAGLPLLDDPWAWLAEQLNLSIESTLICSSACRPKVLSGVSPPSPTIIAWAIATTA